jgi:hypothetical protein
MWNMWWWISFSHPRSFDNLCLTLSNCQKNFLKTWGFFSSKDPLWFLWSHSSISSKQFAFIVPPSIDAPSSTTFQSVHYNCVTIAHHFTNHYQQAMCVKQIMGSTTWFFLWWVSPYPKQSVVATLLSVQQQAYWMC